MQEKKLDMAIDGEIVTLFIMCCRHCPHLVHTYNGMLCDEMQKFIFNDRVLPIDCPLEERYHV